MTHTAPHNDDAIRTPRLTILATSAAHARAVAEALGWHRSTVALCSPTRWRAAWPPRGGLFPPRLIASPEMTPEMCLADGADLVLAVTRPHRGGPLWLDFHGAEHEPRSGLMRRLRAGLLGPRWA